MAELVGYLRDEVAELRASFDGSAVGHAAPLSGGPLIAAAIERMGHEGYRSNVFRLDREQVREFARRMLSPEHRYRDALAWAEQQGVKLSVGTAHRFVVRLRQAIHDLQAGHPIALRQHVEAASNAV